MRQRGIRELRSGTGNGSVFPSIRSPFRPDQESGNQPSPWLRPTERQSPIGNSSSPGAVPAATAHATKSGVSLIIVIGILLLISLIVLSFVKVTHDSTDTAQLATERLRSDHLLHAAVGRAMEDVNARMAGKLFYWDTTNSDLAADYNCLVSTNGTGSSGDQCRDLVSPTVLAEIPSCLTNEVVLMATNACQWIPFDSGASGRYAYVVVNLSGFLDANVVGGMPSSNRTNPAEFDLSPLFYSSTADRDTFFSDRTNHVRYETRNELRALNRGTTNLYDDPFTVYSYDPDRDVYFTSTNNIGTRLFGTNLQRKLCVNNIAFTSLVTVLANSVTNPGFVADCILDYQDTDRILGTNNFVVETNRITEAIPLLNEVHATTNVSASNMSIRLEFWYPFYPPPTNEVFRALVSASNTLGTATTNVSLSDLDFTHFTTESIEIRCSPGDAVTMEVAIQSAPSGGNWTTNGRAIATYHLPTVTNRNYSLNDPRFIDPENVAETIGAMNANCHAWDPECQGLPIYLPNRPMRNIGELGYIWTGDPWKTLDLTQTNVAALLDRCTVRNAPRAQRGLVNAGTTVTSVWETVLTGIPIGFTNSAMSMMTTTSIGQVQQIAGLLAGRTALFSRDFADLLNFIGTSPGYTNFLSTNAFVGVDQREDLLRGIVELISFRHQLYLVVVAAQSLGADGRTMTAERRGVVLVWRDGYTGQYFVRNFRWITD